MQHHFANKAVLHGAFVTLIVFLPPPSFCTRGIFWPSVQIFLLLLSLVLVEEKKLHLTRDGMVNSSFGPS